MQDGHPPVKPMPKYKTFDFWLIQIYVNPNIPAHKWGGGGGPPLGGVNGINDTENSGGSCRCGGFGGGCTPDFAVPATRSLAAVAKQIQILLLMFRIFVFFLILWTFF